MGVDLDTNINDREGDHVEFVFYATMSSDGNDDKGDEVRNNTNKLHYDRNLNDIDWAIDMTFDNTP